MIVTIAPIGNRHVVIDADKIDIGISPQRVEMEIPVVASVLRLIPKIFGPVRRIADLGGAPQQCPRFSGQRSQGRNCRKSTVCTTDLRQAAHLGTDTERIHPTSGRANRGIVQYKP